MKKSLCILFTCVLLLSAIPAAQAADTDFDDVPPTYWAYEYINQIHTLGITNGIGNNLYGPERTITVWEFAEFMRRMTGWTQSNLPNANEPITREQMAVMVVRALGLDALGQRLQSWEKAFPDVSQLNGYITIARDFGVINGMKPDAFAPGQTATRAQAAAMLVRMTYVANGKAAYRNGFYAISSAAQMDRISSLDAVSFGWSRLELNDGVLTLNTTAANDNEYRIPQGYNEPLSLAGAKTKMLMAAVRDADSAAILADPSLRSQAVKLLSEQSLALDMDGVTVDFETLKGDASKANLNAFLLELRQALGSRLIFVAVHPIRRAGVAYYDGYDYKTIGTLADKVVLMAHDYYPKLLTLDEMERGIVMTPSAPLDEVYFALRAACDPVTGITDRSKLLLQISFDTVQWKTIDGKVQNAVPYHPAWEAIQRRIENGAERKFDAATQSNYIVFYNDEDKTNNVVWYEGTESVAAKEQLARYFGIGGLSYWRLGLMP